MRLRTMFNALAGTGAAASLAGCATETTAPVAASDVSLRVGVLEEPRAEARVGARPLGDAVVFARFPDLDAAATEQRLEALRKEPATADILGKLTGTLAKEGVSAKDIEGLVLPLIKGATMPEANVTLAAVMRDQYDTQLRAAFLERALGVPDVLQTMITRNTVLTTAAFGAVPPRERLTRR